MKELIAKAYAHMVRQEFALLGRRLTQDDRQRCAKHVDKWLSDKTLFNTSKETNGELQYFLTGRHASDENGGKRIYLFAVMGPSPTTANELLLDVKRAQDRFKEKRVGLVMSITQEPLRRKLASQGFQLGGYDLMGRVSDATRYLRDRTPRYDNVTISPMQFPKHRQAVIASTIAAFQANPTANARFDTARTRRGLGEFLALCVKAKKAFVLEVDGELAGSFAWRDLPNRSTGYIGSIAVHPDFQGQGLGLLLYEQAMRDFRSHGLRYFVGSSRTNKVLRLAPKMGRQRVRSYSKL